MAAFTTMALIGLGMAAGVGAAKLATKGSGEQQAQGGQATPEGYSQGNPAGQTPPSATPSPPPARRAAAFQSANAAATKQRRRASAGTGVRMPKGSVPRGSGLGSAGVTNAKTLLGY